MMLWLFDKKTAQILASAEINYTELVLTGLRSHVRGEPSPVLTVRIVAKEGSQCEKWRDVTKRISRAVSGDLHAFYSVGLIYEILHRQYHALPLLKIDSIYGLHDQVCGSIVEELGPPDPSCVGCSRYGPSIRHHGNPPMVVVDIRDMTARSFHDDNKKVQNILERLGIKDMSVLVRRESSWDSIQGNHLVGSC